MQNSGKIVDYMISAESDWVALSEIIKVELESGWSLYGFPFCADRYFFQAMIKYEELDSQQAKDQETQK